MKVVYIYFKNKQQNGRRIIAIKPLLMMDSWKKKIGKIYIRMGWISISRIIGRHDPAGKSGRVVCDLFDAFRWGDIVRVQERHGAHEGKFYCPSVQILISFTWYSTRCIFIRSPISTFMIEDGSSFFYFLLLCVSLSAMYIRNNSLHEYIKPSWARSNNLRCLLMINDPSRSKEKAATMLSYATQ